ncbi:MAG: hypothetical protein HYS12_00720 [Planctomycetes bacterium]|nr:hypothetical protein [Planctomycetota bacterium]
MRIVEPPSLDSPWRGRHGDDVDWLLSDFFRAELPKPWPAAPVPDEQPRSLPLSPRKPARRWSASRSRFALAASVALLLIGGWFLSGKFADVSELGGSFTRPIADTDQGHPRKNIKEDGIRTRERIILDKNGQTGFQVELDLP